MTSPYPTPLVVLVDDLRSFADGRPALEARTSAEALQLLERLRGTRIDQLWLDHDLGGEDTTMPVVTLLERAAFQGCPVDVGTVVVHTSNPAGAARIVAALRRYGYHVLRVDAALAGLVDDSASGHPATRSGDVCDACLGQEHGCRACSA